MAEPDIARVVSIIMENPQLLEEIKRLAARDEGDRAVSEAATDAASIPEPSAATEVGGAVEIRPERRGRRRTELLEALKPYISDERKKAIESFITIADILDMMRAK